MSADEKELGVVPLGRDARSDEKSTAPVLEPCPFCSAAAEIRAPYCRVECSNTDCNPMPTVRGRTLNEAIAAWNRRSANAHHGLVEALRGIVLVCGSTGNHFDDFEEQAAAFRRETGLTRPGKDVAFVEGPEDIEARRVAYTAWVDRKLNAARAELTKLTEI